MVWISGVGEVSAHPGDFVSFVIADEIIGADSFSVVSCKIVFFETSIAIINSANVINIQAVQKGLTRYNPHFM